MHDDREPSQPPAGRSETGSPGDGPAADRPDDNSRAAPAGSDGEAFRTPEEVAADDDLTPPAGEPDNDAPAPDRSGRGGWRDKLRPHWPPGKKEWAVIVIIIILVAAAVFLITRPHANAKPAVKTAPPAKMAPAKPTTVPSTLSGLPVNPSVNERPVTGVMIENSTAARPQSGLGQAMVVFEALAEGGVTRFLALYQDTSPGSVGPIRSLRPYYEQWALGFNAAVAHVGGSPEALADVKIWDARDLDQFANSGYYQRVSSRPAPHNVYSSIARLNQLEASKGYTGSVFTGFPRKKAAPAKQVTAGSISLKLSSSTYNVQYAYDAATNSYKRSEGGAPQVDANSGAQISPTVVIAMVIPESNGALDASGAYYSNYSVIGSGPVYVFQDGTVTSGTWTKSGNTSQVTFADANGQTIQLDPGQTWLTAITSTKNLSYSP